MTNVKRKVLAAVIACFVSAGAFAQKRDEGRRPPKNPDKVVVQPKQEKPPKDNRNNDKRDGGRRGRP